MESKRREVETDVPRDKTAGPCIVILTYKAKEALRLTRGIESCAYPRAQVLGSPVTSTAPHSTQPPASSHQHITNHSMNLPWLCPGGPGPGSAQLDPPYAPRLQPYVSAPPRRRPLYLIRAGRPRTGGVEVRRRPVDTHGFWMFRTAWNRVCRPGPTRVVKRRAGLIPAKRPRRREGAEL